MVNLTISLSEETTRKLRKTIREHYGNRKGSISGLIEESLKQRLESFEVPELSQTFKALKDERVVAESQNLDLLAKSLKKIGVDPRSVRVISTKKLPTMVRTGPRRRVA